MRPVSVIIPTYNRAEFLELAVASVFEQSWQQFELIVVDDGSTDQTAELLAKKFPDERLRYICQDNQGASAARNAGIRAATCDFIAFLDSDDRFDSSKLECQIATMLSSPEFLVSHTQEIWFRRGKHLNQKKKHRKDTGYIFNRCLELCAVGMSTSIVRRKLFDEVGFFDEQMPCCEDYDLWLRTSIGHEFLLVDEPLTIKDGGRPDQLSYQYRVGMDRYRIKSILKILESESLDSAQRDLAVAELIRKCQIYGKGCLKHGREAEGQEFLSLVAQFT